MPEDVVRGRLREVLGGSPSPEVPWSILRKDLELIGGGALGYYISKYGVEGLKLLYNAVGEATKTTLVKDWSPYLARGTGAGVSVIGLLLLRGKWSRILAFGATFENLIGGVSILEDAVRKAIGV